MLIRRNLPSVVISYLICLVLVAVAALVVWLIPELRVAPLLFVPPIMISAWLGGMWPGLLATILSVAALDYLLFEPRYSFGVVRANDLLDASVFSLVAILTSWLVKQRRIAEEEARQVARRLQESDRNKDEFLAMLAHELRNPLAPITYAAQIIQMQHEDQDDGELQEACRVITDQVAHLARLIDDLLDISRIRSGKVTLERELVDLRSIVSSAQVTCEPPIRQHRHELTVSMPPEPVWLEADPARLRQVLVNLLGNAVKYTDPGGKIQLTVERARDSAIVHVRDNGVGIPRDMLAHIFELFTQAPSALDRSQGGLGIGLSVVRRLVDMHGGTIAVLSAGEGQGTEFVVQLPTAAPPPHSGVDAGARAAADRASF